LVFSKASSTGSYLFNQLSGINVMSTSGVHAAARAGSFSTPPPHRF
jgi:hypothetical protein